MAKNLFREHETLFCRIFTQSVVSWNNAEWAAQRILEGFVKGGLGSLVVLHHLKNVALQDALLATADLLDTPGYPANQAVASHVRHFVDGLALCIKTPNALNALAGPAKPISSLEKPTWPERLKKNRSYLQALPLQPEPSQE